MSDVTDGIREYLSSGGLFNPELMDHQRVRDLVIECRDEIERLRQRLAERLIDYCVCNNCNSPTDGCNCVACATKRLEAEIERLRGLLREYLTKDGQEFVGTYSDWLRRIREALGD